jgi:tetratricopeptide (TPR) repeat protein
MLRKQQGLLEEEQQNGGGALNQNSKAAPDLFNTGSANAEWYFNNNSLKGKGYNDFKTRWGNRANTDNWRVSTLARNARDNGRNPNGATQEQDDKQAATSALTYKLLLDNLPLTPAKLKTSNDSIEKALFTLGKACQEGPPDYESAVKYYEQLLERFPESRMREETLFGLYYCYKKLGDEVNANRILLLMKQKYPSGAFTAKAINPDSAEAAGTKLRTDATRKYESVYNSFIEGRFDEALAGKKQADSLYGEKYWTPQLLYIESVYFIHQRQDNNAIASLHSIINKYPKTPMAEKAERLIDVLGRRKQIEDYLTKLQIQRAKDDSVSGTDSSKTVVQQKTHQPDADSLKNIKEDTTQYARAKINMTRAALTRSGNKPGTPADSLNKLKIDTAGLNKIRMDANQLASLQRKADSLQAAMLKARDDADKLLQLKHQSDSIRTAMRKLKNDSLQLASRIQSLHSAFGFKPDQPHAVVILENKVDPVYVTESKNAFDRYNRETYYNQTFTIENVPLDDTLKMVVIRGFDNAASALDYMGTARQTAAREIIPWLPAAKYSFLIISEANLEILKGNKDVNGYRKFLETSFPGKF